MWLVSLILALAIDIMDTMATSSSQLLSVLIIAVYCNQFLTPLKYCKRNRKEGPYLTCQLHCVCSLLVLLRSLMTSARQCQSNWESDSKWWRGEIISKATSRIEIPKLQNKSGRWRNCHGNATTANTVASTKTGSNGKSGRGLQSRFEQVQWLWICLLALYKCKPLLISLKDKDGLCIVVAHQIV